MIKQHDGVRNCYHIKRKSNTYFEQILPSPTKFKVKGVVKGVVVECKANTG